MMLVAVMCAAFAGQAWATDPSVTFTFNTDAGLTQLGISKPASGKGTNLGSSEYTISPITMTATDGATATRVWNSSGTCSLRVYKSGSGTLTFSTTTSYKIKTVALGSGSWTASTGKMSGSSWSGEAQTVTFTCTANATISTITISYSVPAPSITAADVNIAADVLAGNISYNIANPDGSTLTAAKKSGDWLTVGAVDEVNNKVAFTATENTGAEREAVVTLTYGDVTKDVTITQAAAATKYEVTYSTPSNGTLVVKRGETTVSSGDEVSDGTVLTIEATPSNDHDYALSKWEYKEDGGSWTDGEGTSYTIDGKDVEFRATFVARIYHNITYSVNGATTVVEVEEGDDISFAAPASGVPAGYTFKGWVVAADKIDTPTDTDPKDNYVTSGKSTADITYYAVMAVEISVPHTETLTESEITTNLTNTTCAYGTEKNYTDGDIKWTISAYTDNNSRPWMQLKKANNSYIKITAPTLAKITGLTFTITSASNSSGGVTDITKHTDYSGSIYVDTSAKSTPTGGLGSTSTVSSDQMSLSVSGNNNVVYMQVGSGARIWGIEVSYNTTSTSHYCTTVSDVPVKVGSAGYTTITTDLAVSFEGSGVTAYKATAVNPTTIHLEEVEEAPAGTPLVIKASEGTHMIDVVKSATSVGTNILESSDGTAAGDGTIYALGKIGGVVGFYLVGDDVAIPAGKAYITIPTPVKEFLTFDFDDATAIAKIQDSGSKIQDSEIFNLAGQKMSKLQKGVNIVNGKKVLVK